MGVVDEALDGAQTLVEFAKAYLGSGQVLNQLFGRRGINERTQPRLLVWFEPYRYITHVVPTITIKPHRAPRTTCNNLDRQRQPELSSFRSARRHLADRGQQIRDFMRVCNKTTDLVITTSGEHLGVLARLLWLRSAAVGSGWDQIRR